MNTKIGATGILPLNRRVLLGRRNHDDSQGGMWVTPGGGVEYGEEINAAIVREFMEETGLTVRVSEDFTSVQQRITERGHVVMVFKPVILISGEAMPLDGFDMVKWFRREDVFNMIELNEVTYMTAMALKEYFARYPF